MMSDAELLSAADSGSRVAFGVLFERYRPRLTRTALSKLGSLDLAEEAVSSTFLEVWRRRGGARAVDGSLGPWMFAILDFVCMNTSRSVRRERRLVHRLRSTEVQADHAEESDERIDCQRRVAAIADILEALTERDQIVVEVCLIRQLSVREASDLSGLSEAALRSRLKRLRARLRGQLGGPPR